MSADIGSGIGKLVVDLYRRLTAVEKRSGEIPTLVQGLNSEAGARFSGDAELSAALIAEAKSRSGGDKWLADSIAEEAKNRASADVAEAATRVAAVKAVADGLDAEAKRAAKAEAEMQGRLVTLSGTLSPAAGLTVSVGKTERKVAVSGLKKGDGITVTPATPLPGNMTLGDPYCLADNELTLSTIVTGTLALAISAKTEIPLIVKALR